MIGSQISASKIGLFCNRLSSRTSFPHLRFSLLQWWDRDCIFCCRCRCPRCTPVLVCALRRGHSLWTRRNVQDTSATRNSICLYRPSDSRQTEITSRVLLYNAKILDSPDLTYILMNEIYEVLVCNLKECILSATLVLANILIPSSKGALKT